MPLSHLPVRTVPDSGLHAGIGGSRALQRVSVEYDRHDKGAETESVCSGLWRGQIEVNLAVKVSI